MDNQTSKRCNVLQHTCSVTVELVAGGIELVGYETESHFRVVSHLLYGIGKYVYFNLFVPTCVQMTKLWHGLTNTWLPSMTWLYVCVMRVCFGVCNWHCAHDETSVSCTIFCKVYVGGEVSQCALKWHLHSNRCGEQSVWQFVLACVGCKSATVGLHFHDLLPQKWNEKRGAPYMGITGDFYSLFNVYLSVIVDYSMQEATHTHVPLGAV